MKGKEILGWLKRRWPVVLCLALAVVPPGVAFYFSSGWNKKIRDEQTKMATGYKQKLDAAKVTYSLPSPAPGVQEVSLKIEPNTKVTEFFKAKKDVNAADSAKVMDDALRHNQSGADRVPLIPDLFPRPKNLLDRTARTVDFVKVLVGDRQRTGAYQKLLADMNAGGPADPARVASELADEKERSIEAIRGPNQGRQITKDEGDAIDKKLLQRRVGIYQSRAAQISLYADLNMFEPKRVPRQVPTRPPSIARCFAWQTDYWAASDVLAAIKKANTPAGAARPTSVDKAVVKRIEGLVFTMPLVYIPGEGDAPPRAPRSPDGQPAAPLPAGNDGTAALLEANYGLAITGRLGGNASAVRNESTNQMYDTVYLKLGLVVSSERLPELIDAISSSNFMSVVGLNLREVNVWEHLEQGYYYGAEHVIHADIEVELVWLRSWTLPFMPKSVKSELGIPIPPPAPDAPPEEPEEDESFPGGEAGGYLPGRGGR